MTDTEQKLLAENEALKSENEYLRQKINELTKPATPVIEILDETHAKFNGQIFAKTKKGHFYRAVSLHEAVWRFHFGDIPDGYVIHHRNGDKGDNRIENLQLMTAAEHRAWHNSHDKISYRCDYCGKEIEKFHTSRFGDKHFCDAQCWGRYIHANKIYYEERTCVICGKKFLVYKYRKTQTCSPECHHELISRSKRKKSSS